MQKSECDSVPGELRKKIRKILAFILIEISIFLMVGLITVGIDLLSPELSFIPVAARFLGLSIAFHIYMGFIELKDLRREPYAKGDL